MKLTNKFLAAIKRLDPNTSSGFGDIPVKLLTNCADVLCVPLTFIFNMCILNCEYPDALKMSNIVPVFKGKGNKICIEGYRGISILPIIDKLFESLIKDQLQPHLKRLIVDEQHGFQPKKSCFTNLACYSEFISSALDDKHEVHAIYTDFQRAFDVVPHNLLLYKMKCLFGFQANALQFFESYLTNRLQRVVIQGVASEWVEVTSGVPQGSILGPWLFSIYVNDIPKEMQSSKSLLFADDGKFFRIITCIVDCLLLQHDIDQLCKWCDTWGISLNVSKCYFIPFTLKRMNKIDFIYTINGSVVEQVDVIRDLGVYFTSKFCFKYHVEQICKKANRMLGFVRRVVKPFYDEKVLICLYRTHVRSSLEYCTSIFSPHQEYLRNRIESIQRRAVKWICFKSRTPYSSSNYIYLCEKFGLPPLSARREVTDLRNFNKLLTNNLNCSELVENVFYHVPTRQLRRNRLFVSSSRLELRKHSFFPRVQRTCDEYDFLDIFENNSLTFKRAAEAIFY